MILDLIKQRAEQRRLDNASGEKHVYVIEMQYEFVDGWHVFTCADFPECSVANIDFDVASATVSELLEQRFSAEHKKLCFVMAPEDHSPGQTVVH